MKKLSIIIFVLAVVIGGAVYYVTSQPAVTPEDQQVPVGTEGWKTFSKWGIEIKYPPEWIAEENTKRFPDALEGVLVTGDGYSIRIDPNGGFGEFPPDEYRSIQLRVADQMVDAGEEINPRYVSYFVVFSLYRPGNQDYYFFRASAKPEIPAPIAKEKIAQILGTVRLVQ